MGLDKIQKRRKREKLFKTICFVVSWFSLLILLVLLAQILLQGLKWVNLDFLMQTPSRFPKSAGIKTAIWGTLWLVSMTAFFSIPLGIAAAIYLEEYIKAGKLRSFILLNISNLAGVPSVIYGLLGLSVFVRFFGFGRSLWGGSLTLTLLALPVVIIATREAISSVPNTIRYAAYALGASKWQTIWSHVLPIALPGIMTGVILSIARAIGETAPIIIIGAASYVAFVPTTPMDQFTTIPIQIFNWSSRPQQDFHELAGAAIIIFLLFLFLVNFSAIYIRLRSQKDNL